MQVIISSTETVLSEEGVFVVEVRCWEVDVEIEPVVVAKRMLEIGNRVATASLVLSVLLLLLLLPFLFLLYFRSWYPELCIFEVVSLEEEGCADVLLVCVRIVENIGIRIHRENVGFFNSLRVLLNHVVPILVLRLHDRFNLDPRNMTFALFPLELEYLANVVTYII